ncbi:MAG: hypothetical protein F6J94_08100 [Moorea sp. SIO1F2]|uniref:hypothetical protein n=1 Tax=Moorena sp. SIO1F2 TaxID=2607819 RepID=UPI0013B85E1A|nr:hypothetical protein [Moorena sp. SIO1F2]NET81904.1 hypothetical protein [Moorena sp. SIO1F2]
MELASCQFHAYLRAGRMPTLLLFIQRLTQRQFSFPDSRLPTPDSRLPTPKHHGSR